MACTTLSDRPQCPILTIEPQAVMFVLALNHFRRTARGRNVGETALLVTQRKVETLKASREQAKISAKTKAVVLRSGINRSREVSQNTRICRHS